MKTVQQVMDELNEQAERAIKKRATHELKLLAKADWTGVDHVHLPKSILQGVVDHIYRVEEELSAAKKQLQNPPHTVSIVQPEPTVAKRKFKPGDRVRLVNHPDAEFTVQGYADSSYKYYYVYKEKTVLLSGGPGEYTREDALEFIKQPKFQIGDRVCSTTNPMLRYIVTGPHSYGKWTVKPNSTHASDVVRNEFITKRIPLSEFTFKDLQVGDTVRYRNEDYTVDDKYNSIEEFKAHSKKNKKAVVLMSSEDLKTGSVRVVDTPQ